MSPKNRAFIENLLKLEREPNGNFPKEFDYLSEIKRLRQVHQHLLEVTARELQLNTSMQDSHSIGEIASLPKSWEELTLEVQQQGHFAFEFSAFGCAFTDVFTIRNLEKHTGCKPIASLEPLIEIIEGFEYIYLPPNELMEIADGYTDSNEWGSRWYNQIFYYG